jgi:metal-dependent amidase/aminoacylase/carboxypeptidase family protein
VSELDALPIHEINTFEHRSLTNGVSHKCGHDGHMAILCGLAIELHRSKPKTESYSINPLKKMVAVRKKCFQTQNLLHLPRLCFALHNLPGYPKNQIIVKMIPLLVL